MVWARGGVEGAEVILEVESFKVCVNTKGEVKHSFLTKTVSLVLIRNKKIKLGNS